LRLAGLAGGDAMLVDASPHWPAVRIVADVADADVANESVTDAEAVLRLKTGGRLTLDRAGGVARYTVPRRLTSDEIVHPFLAPAAAVFSHWAGRLSFHAGAFVAGGGVWAVVGEREAGKSSTLAALAMAGQEVFSDDVLVLDGLTAFAGPRAIDLRQETAERFGVGAALGIVGSRPRWRIALTPASPELAFRGWMFLSWGEGLDIRRLGPSECLYRLMETLTVRIGASDPRGLLELATLPAWSFRRARDLERLDDDTHRLLELARS
jgi:hypothetical protein